LNFVSQTFKKYSQKNLGKKLYLKLFKKKFYPKQFREKLHPKLLNKVLLKNSPCSFQSSV